MRRFLSHTIADRFTGIVLLIAGLFLAACDTTQEEPPNAIHLSISPYASNSSEAMLSIDDEQATKLAQFPRRHFQGVISDLEIFWKSLDLPDTFDHSVYMLISVPAINMTQLIPFGTSHSANPAKSASNDSMDVFLSFFIVEKPGLTYPQEIQLLFSINEVDHEVILNTSSHMIRLDKQIISAGLDLHRTSSTEGINVRVSSTQIDTSIIPISLLSNLIFTPTAGESSRETLYLAGNCLASILNKPCHEWASPNHHLASDSQIRFLLLSK